MTDIEGQLARLKQRVANVNRRYDERSYELRKAAALNSAPRRFTAGSFIEEWSEGQVVQTEAGQHFETERLYAAHRYHGSADIGALAHLSHDLLDALGGGEIQPASPLRWAFLDTETTGLAGGTGTYAFLVGVGRITAEGFRVRQFFMREYLEERSVLFALEQHLADFDVLITYNGKSYDQPLLETRYRLSRQKPPFTRLQHLDLLHGSRRLWKLRLENCRLIQLEQQILGFEREGDLPGELIPYVYFEYLRSKEARQLVPIFHHNALDILTLACLTGIVPAAFRSTDAESLAGLGVRRGEELAGIGHWLIAAGEPERGLDLLKRAVAARVKEPLLFKTLWNIALLEKKAGRVEAALAVFNELAGCRNEFRVAAFEELAKFYEHQERDYAQALEFTTQALAHQESPELVNRKQRLERRINKPRSRRLAEITPI